MAQTQPMIDPKHVLLFNRIIWAAIAMGVLTFAGIVIAVGLGPRDDQSMDQTGRLLFYVSCAMVVTAIPLGLFVRGQVFKRGWVGDVIMPQAYNTGNIIAWACCEAPAIVALVGCMISGALMPNILPALASFVMHLLLWPNGRAMFAPSTLEDRYPTT